MEGHGDLRSQRVPPGGSSGAWASAKRDFKNPAKALLLLFAHQAVRSARERDGYPIPTRGHSGPLTGSQSAVMRQTQFA
jgi:hypothetical protein